jgi:hypothetical protein
MKENLKKETLDFLKNREVVSASITRWHGWMESEDELVLRMNSSSDEKIEFFFKKLDFSYNNDGFQKIFGTLWFQDGSWATRRVKDNRERWEHRLPPAPKLK